MCRLCLPGKRKKKRKKNPTCCGICWRQRTHLLVRGLVAGTRSQQVGTWGVAGDGPVLGASLPGAPEFIPSSPDPFILVPYMLTHTCPSLTCLLFPVFTRCPGADSPEPQADMKVEKPAARDTEPAETEKSPSSNSQPDAGLCFQSGFLQIFACIYDVTLALDDR